MPKKGNTWVLYDRDGAEVSHNLDPADYFKIWCFIDSNSSWSINDPLDDEDAGSWDDSDLDTYE